MKLKKNPLLEDHGPLYKIIYYVGPYLLIILFILMWNNVASKGNNLLPTPLATLKRLIVVWSTKISKKPMIYHVGI